MKRYRLDKPNKIRLKDFDPGDTACAPRGKDWALAKLEKMKERIFELQDLLYANQKKKMLVVLQGMDTAGKDGTIAHVFSSVNPQGVRVASFKKPTRIELAHDYLWRIHLAAPRSGEIAIFNRSQYEDVLSVRVHKEISEAVCEKRYKQINHFEEMLAEEDTLILKFYLHISREEQTERLRSRLETKEKQWKLSAADLAERAYWKDYIRAYEAVLNHCSTAHAPWYVVPANHKWYRNDVISSLLVKALESLNLKTPKPEDYPAEIFLK